jgi:tRNA-splicing ligase RtcB
LFKNVPSGLGSKGTVRLSKDDLKEVLEKGVEYLKEQGFANKDDLMNCEEKGRMKQAKSSVISDKALGRGLPQLGSLGSGNHFLDVHVVDELIDEKKAEKFGLFQSQIVFTIHCGSRGLGHQVASDYLRKIEKSYPELIKSLSDRELAYAPAGSDLASEYFSAMSCAANYAWANRQLIMHNVRERVMDFFNNSKDSLGLDLFYDVCHNICKVETHEGIECFVHRKGATRSFPGDKVIIPGSMGTNSYLLVGGENSMKKSFGSTAHGAGRIMSRTKAKKTFNPNQVISDMKSKGIILKSSTKWGAAEEASGVYKDVDEVVRVSNSLGIAKPIARLRPIAVING